eukprot:scaffold9424_cov53-Phaeocystis_antarctica.AAC.2
MDMLADAALGSRPVADLPKHLPNERPPPLPAAVARFHCGPPHRRPETVVPREVVVLWERKLASKPGTERGCCGRCRSTWAVAPGRSLHRSARPPGACARRAMQPQADGRGWHG